MSEWLAELARQCEQRSQRQVAAELGVSPAQVNQALKGTYKGDLARLQQLVEGRYMKRTVQCPVLGEISTDKCRFHQEREFAATNPQRVMLYKACRSGCPHSQLGVSIRPDPQWQRLEVQQARREPGYQVEQQLEALRAQAGGSAERYAELLESELRQVGARLNDLLWQRKYKRT